MKVRFWGVRGSIASPGRLTSRYGGNTSCAEVLSDAHRVILDGGTGLRDLGNQLMKQEGGPPSELHLLLTHFHIDHICGLPFFGPLYEKGVTIHVYGPQGLRRPLKRVLSAFFSEEFFPVPLKKIPATLKFHPLGDDDKCVKIGPFTVSSFHLNHPGRTLGYVIEGQRRSVAYLSDHEPLDRFRHIQAQEGPYESMLRSHLKRADLLIHDSQFTDEEYPRYRGWGHSPLSYTLALAETARVKKLVLFHHAPHHDDRLLARTLLRLRNKLAQIQSPLQVVMGREGETIEL